MKIRMMMVAAVVAPTALAMTACDIEPACSGLTVSDRDREAAANGYEVEKQDNSGNTCELSRDGQSWSVDD